MVKIDKQVSFWSSIGLVLAMPALADIAPYPLPPALPTVDSSAAELIPLFIVLMIVCNYGFTLVFELPILYAFGFRTGKAILWLSVVNLLSVVGLHVAVLVFDYSILMMEVLVVVLELLLIWPLFRKMTWWKLLLGVITANLVSGIIGTLLVGYIRYLISFT